MRRSLPLVAAASAALLLAACIDDTPVAPSTGTPAGLALSAVVSGASQAPPGQLAIVARVTYFLRNESERVLTVGVFPADSVPRLRRLDVDLLPCLLDTLRMEPGPWCDVRVQLALATPDSVLDVAPSSWYRLRPGAEVRGEATKLYVQNVAPTLDSLSALQVLPDLFIYRVVSRDANGNIAGLSAMYRDTLFGPVFMSRELSPVRRDTLRATFYGFLGGQSPVIVPRATVATRDDRYLQSTAVQVPVLIPDQLAPSASVRAGALEDTVVTLQIGISDADTNAVAAEVLVRDRTFELIAPTSDSLTARCVRPLPAGSGVMTVSCSGSFAALDSVRAIVIPVDRSGRIGRGGSVVISRP